MHRLNRLAAAPRRAAVGILGAALTTLAVAAEAPQAPAPKPAPAAAPAAKPAAAAAPAPAAAPQAADTAKFPDVVAHVNGYELKKVQLVNQAGAMLQQGQTPTLEFYKAVLEQMVGTRLLFDESVAHKLTASDEDVEKMFAGMRARFQGDEAEFNKQVAASGITIAELKQSIRENLSIRNLVSKEIAPTVTVSDADAQKFYDQNGERMQRPEQVEVSHILVGIKPGASDADKAAAKKKAEDLLAKVKAGGDFAQLAKDNSDDPGSKTQGGSLGWISKGQTVPEFETAAFALKAGETSGVVESQFGFHIIRVQEHRAAGKAPFADTKAQITNFLHERGIAEALRKHVADLRTKAKVDIAI